MAQILISTIDPENGSVNATVQLKDKYLSRIYSAYRYSYARQILNQKISKGEVLEANDTVEHLSDNVFTQDILDDLLERFTKDLINFTHSIETEISIQKIRATMDKIEFE